MRILVVSPHLDDETLGAGGTLMRYKQESHDIFWSNMPSVTEADGWDNTFIEQRKKQLQKVCSFYGFQQFYPFEYPARRLDELGRTELVSKLDHCFNEIKPNWVILPDLNDIHSDHKTVFETCYSCTKIFRHSSIKMITTIEILSETNFGDPYSRFITNLYVNISAYMGKKLEAIQLYDAETAEHPFSRSIDSIRSLGILRGSEVGVRFLEAFKMLKIMIWQDK